LYIFCCLLQIVLAPPPRLPNTPTHGFAATRLTQQFVLLYVKMLAQDINQHVCLAIGAALLAHAREIARLGVLCVNRLTMRRAKEAI
jgi:hypothetical protein